MKTLCKNLINIVMLAVASYSAAAPARPGIHKITLPDGSTLTYRAVGDENFHYFVTDDGYPVVFDADGGAFFARNDAGGRLVSSGIPATDPVQRTPEARAYLSTLDAPAIIEHAAENPKRRIAPRRSASRAPESMRTEDFPATGSPRTCVILVEYSDLKFTVTNPKAYYSDMLNLEGFGMDGATGSVRDYFKDASSGAFTPVFDVYGPVTLPNPQKYYGENDLYGVDIRAHEMAIHACDILSASGVNFADYDCDGDGTIDNIYVFYAGRGESSGLLKDKDTVWPHSWTVQEAGGGDNLYSGKLLAHYACSNELITDTKYDGIGTFCHEFSHVIGLPDMYYTGTGRGPITLDTWSVLDAGCYLNDSRTPPHYSAFERMSMGWLKPEALTKAGDYSLRPLGMSNSAYIVATNLDNEFFLLENRRRDGWDSHLPGEGLLVWHIDYDKDNWMNNAVNNSSSFPGVDLVEAVPRTSSRNASPSDPFPGASGVCEFTATSNPAFLSRFGYDPGLPLTSIRHEGELICFHAGEKEGSAITDITNDSGIIIKGGEAIVIEGTHAPATVHTPAGLMVYTGSSRYIPLPPGLYIVHISGRTFKIIVH